MTRIKMGLSQKYIFMCWLFVLPVLLFRMLTSLYPIITAFYYSLLDYDLIARTKEFGGLINFMRLTENQAFLDSLSFTFRFTVFSLCGIIVFGTSLALLLKQDFGGRKILRTVALIPWGLPTIIVAIAGSWAFNDSFGIVNDMIRRIGFSEFSFGWLSSNTGAQAAVIMVNIWKNTPFFAIMMLAAFQGIPNELFESARIDGASATRIFIKISMPYVMRTFILAIIFVGIWQINSFEIVYGMTRGGPGFATSLLSYRLFMEATRNLNYGMASAIASVMFMITAAFGAIGLYLYRKVDY